MKTCCKIKHVHHSHAKNTPPCIRNVGETLRKYILEDFLSKISKLTPNFNLKKNFNAFKKNNFKVLNETKNIHLKKQNFSRQDLLPILQCSQKKGVPKWPKKVWYWI